ncbi:hypothetical protein CASFOL_022805 [Castilleja foliolosa]|uniref:Uncharacterized protein n=1 Tax=Castilleja foliolosa TaxID=1961234 RepID=A0ABD3CTF0_9LAMI
MTSADNNNMSIELYNPSQVGETDATNPTINANSNPAKAADLSTTISDNHNADFTTGWEWRCIPERGLRSSNGWGIYEIYRPPEDEWETFPWGVYSFQILMFRMKNAVVKPEDNYHIYGFSHAFMAFYCRGCTWFGGYNRFEAKTQVRPATAFKAAISEEVIIIILGFFDKQDIQCHEKLEPTAQELIDYTWWPHVDDDVRSSVNYIHKESNAKKTTLRRTLEQSSVPAPGQGDGSITAEEVRPQKRARTTERPNVDSGELLTRILEGVRQENELLEQRLMREMHEIEERAARMSDDLRSEIEKLKKTVDELQRPNNYDEETAQTTHTTTQITTQKTEQTKTGKIAQSTGLKRQKAQGQTTERKSPPPPPPPSAVQDDLYVPFDGNFIDEIEVFADKIDYVRRRGDGEPELTPIESLTIKPDKDLTPIKVQRGLVKKAKANPKFLTIRRAVRPPKDSEPHTYIIDKNNKHMKAYILIWNPTPKRRDCGTGMCQYEDASYFKEDEDPGKCMDIQTIDSYLRILHLNPEFLGCHPEARDKYLFIPQFSAFFTAISQSMYHNNIASAIRDKDKGQMEELNPENDSVKILLDLVQGKPVELIESWGPLVPITTVDKIYVCEV